MLSRSGSCSLPHGVIKGLPQAKGVLSVLMELPTGLKGSGKPSKLQSRLSWRKKNLRTWRSSERSWTMTLHKIVESFVGTFLVDTPPLYCIIVRDRNNGKPGQLFQNGGRENMF